MNENTRAFLLDVMAPLAPVFGPFQMSAELSMGLALLSGALTRLAGAAATFFFANLFLAYLNTTLGEWIWTYVPLIAVAAVVTLGRAGLSWGRRRAAAQALRRSAPAGILTGDLRLGDGRVISWARWLTSSLA